MLIVSIFFWTLPLAGQRSYGKMMQVPGLPDVVPDGVMQVPGWPDAGLDVLMQFLGCSDAGPQMV